MRILTSPRLYKSSSLGLCLLPWHLKITASNIYIYSDRSTEFKVSFLCRNFLCLAQDPIFTSYKWFITVKTSLCETWTTNHKSPFPTWTKTRWMLLSKYRKWIVGTITNYFFSIHSSSHKMRSKFTWLNEVPASFEYDGLEKNYKALSVFLIRKTFVSEENLI